jgi:hypothetical protein
VRINVGTVPAVKRFRAGFAESINWISTVVTLDPLAVTRIGSPVTTVELAAETVWLVSVI